MISEARNFPELALYHEKIAYARARTLLGRVIERGVVRGEFRPLDQDAVVELLIAPLLMHFIWQHSMGATAVRRSIQHAIWRRTLISSPPACRAATIEIKAR